jgi:hypothetical protein
MTKNDKKMLVAMFEFLCMGMARIIWSMDARSSFWREQDELLKTLKEWINEVNK